MRKICKLNEEQRQFADTHHSIVTRFLSHHQLDEAEFYDIVIFGYLLAVQEYLEKPELSRYAFSTIAWRNMKDCVAREYYNRSRDKRTAAIASLNEEVLELEAFLPDRLAHLAEALDNQILLTELLSCMTPKEKEMVHLKADGYTYREIAEKCSITVYGVSSRFSRMRCRLRKMELI
ncbi:sigma-70 family RNA polymerase sigma factor [Marvinbryantia formatexigens]|nr:sigma-70 family RNA polymerase sigma factor [Marvinbryantia formatexigens]UWO23592.1 sigma-70 family RNA polymerase sigma factor [Marvinbryantia formatexigens DSM 14469]SDG83716.1 RNA polymerase sigma-70 factor, ECF subfamily [Marvinbryantia formatexigens]